jgi:hypothetical protein
LGGSSKSGQFNDENINIGHGSLEDFVEERVAEGAYRSLSE